MLESGSVFWLRRLPPKSTWSTTTRETLDHDATLDVRVRRPRAGLPGPRRRAPPALPRGPSAESSLFPPRQSPARPAACRLLGGGVRGPPRYSEDFGGHSAMLSIHAGQGAGEDLGARFVACFVQAADDAGLPDDPDFRAGLRAYMEWAVGEILAYSPPETRVAAGLQVPRWGWTGLAGPHSSRPRAQPGRSTPQARP
jgi:truncated hemoglobin YjbI